MAKKDENQSMYVNAAEQRKKAIGNPNKNVHAKRNGSNYKGTKSAQTAAEKLAAMNQPKGRKRLDPKVRLAIWILVIVGIVNIILEGTVFKDNQTANAISMIVLGLCCGGVYYAQRTTRDSEDSRGLAKAIEVIMLVLCVLYVFLGFMGLR